MSRKTNKLRSRVRIALAGEREAVDRSVKTSHRNVELRNQIAALETKLKQLIFGKRPDGSITLTLRKATFPIHHMERTQLNLELVPEELRYDFCRQSEDRITSVHGYAQRVGREVGYKVTEALIEYLERR